VVGGLIVKEKQCCLVASAASDVHERLCRQTDTDNASGFENALEDPVSEPQRGRSTLWDPPSLQTTPTNSSSYHSVLDAGVEANSNDQATVNGAKGMPPGRKDGAAERC